MLYLHNVLFAREQINLLRSIVGRTKPFEKNDWRSDSGVPV
jgi:hypothetical protein